MINKPHCFGKMIWVTKYEKELIPKHSICNCECKQECLDLTFEIKINDKENQEEETCLI